MFGRQPWGDRLRRLDALEDEVRDLRREVAEQTAAHDDAIDLALILALPNSLYRVLAEARAGGWSFTYSRAEQREQYGSIQLGHPTDAIHDYSIQLPLPDDPAVHRAIESELAVRIRWSRAA